MLILRRRSWVSLLGLALLAFACQPELVAAQTTVLDSACATPLKAATDSLGKLHLATTKPTKYQTRAVATLTAAHTQFCTRVVAPPPAPNPVTRPTLVLTQDADTVRVRPATPYYVFITARGDSAGSTTDAPTFTVLNPEKASTWWNASARRLEVYNADTSQLPGPMSIIGAWGSARDTVTIWVATGKGAATTPPPSPTPAPTPAPLPVDTSALGKIGPTRSPSEALALGNGWARYDSLLTRWAPTRWLADTSDAGERGDWGAGNYYDRALIFFAQWHRTRDATWRRRADSLALSYRRGYLEANAYQASNYWSMLDGVALHYLYAGDTLSRRAVGHAAAALAGTALWPRTGPYTDGRGQARALTAMLVAWQLNAPSAPPGGWAKAIDDGLNAILPQQSADGAWRYPANTCDLSLNYMNAMLADALIRVYESYRKDPRIPGAVARTADYLWTQWRPNDAVPSFNYYEAACSNQHGTGGADATPDLTGLFTTTFAWMARIDAAKYRPRADAVMLGTMRGIYPQGSKQFNQAFAFSWRALGYLP